MGETEETFADLTPYGHLATAEAETLGGFVQLLDTLALWRQQIRDVRLPHEWCADLLKMVEDFFPADIEDVGINLLRAAILRLQTERNNFV